MEARIIGFYFGKGIPSNFNLDVFDSGVVSYELRLLDAKLIVWGFGEIETLLFDNQFVLCPLGSTSLLKRNVLVKYGIDYIHVENDWLGSIPVYYNLVQSSVSTLSLLCSQDERDLSTEGVGYFLKNGYSSFEMTIFENVKFLRYFSRLRIDCEGLKVIYLDDPILTNAFLGGSTSEIDALSIIANEVNHLVGDSSKSVVIPTSGGFDSRILNHAVRDKDRIKSFTYGIGKDQSKSFEAVYAKRISEVIGVEWNQIFLENFLEYSDDWFHLYGFSVHLHGMYQIEFYKKVVNFLRVDDDMFLLSGIVGDAWAGSVRNISISKKDDVSKLFYTHGMSVNSRYLKNFDTSSQDSFWKDHSKYLANERYAVVMLVRTKMILLSYLMEVPTYFGFKCVSPFLDYEVVQSMLSIPVERRRDRIWQKDFFKRLHLNIEDWGIKTRKDNSLNFIQAYSNEFEKLDTSRINHCIENGRVEWINKQLSGNQLFERVLVSLGSNIPMIQKILVKLGYRSNLVTAYYEYCVLRNFNRLI